MKLIVILLLTTLVIVLSGLVCCVSAQRESDNPILELPVTTTWYCDADFITDGSGTSTDPFNTLASLAAALESGDTAYIGGTFREGVTFSDVDNIKIYFWNGKYPLQIRGDTVVELEKWVDNGDGTFTANIGSDKTVGSVVWNWDTNIDNNGNNYGHLTKNNVDPPDVTSEWYYTSPYLTIYPPAGAQNPDIGDVYAWCAGSSDGVYLKNCDGWVWEAEVVCILWTDESAGANSVYGFKVGGTSNSGRYSNITTKDSGKHGFGNSEYTVGMHNWYNCVSYAIRAGQTGAVSYSAAGEVQARYTDCICHGYTLLDTAGKPLEAGNAAGFYAHTNGVESITDIEYTNCKYIGYTGISSNGFGSGTRVAAPADSNNWCTYAIRYIGCELVNSDYQQTYASAFVRCRLAFPRAGNLDALSDATVWMAYEGLLLEACVITTDMDSLANNSRFLWSKQGSAAQAFIISRASVLYNSGVVVETDIDGRRTFLKTDPNGTYTLYGNLFVHGGGANQFCIDNTGTTGYETSNWDCKSNIYYGFEPPGSYGQGIFYDHQAEWESAIDNDALGTIYDQDPGFKDPVNDMSPRPGGYIWLNKNSLPELEGIMGINYHLYDGSYGAYQQAAPGPDSVTAQYRNGNIP